MTEVSNQEKHYEERSLAAWLSQPLTALSDRGFFSLGNSLWCLLFVWMPFFPPHPCLMSTPNEFSRQHCCFHCQMMFHGQRVFTYMVFTAKCVFTAKWFSRPNGFHGQMGFTATRFFHGLLSKLHLATFFMDKAPPRLSVFWRAYSSAWAKSDQLQAWSKVALHAQVAHGKGMKGCEDLVGDMFDLLASKKVF